MTRGGIAFGQWSLGPFATLSPMRTFLFSQLRTSEFSPHPFGSYNMYYVK